MVEKIPSSQNTSMRVQRPAVVEGTKFKLGEEKKPGKQIPQKRAFSKEKVEEIVIGLNKFMQPSHTELKFVFHESLNEYYVTVVDEITKEVIKEIPPKKMLDMYAAMTEFVGLLVDEKI
ncbi:flagellar protein FlaG [Bacillaceae bacterium Marseille-Q3522]|nr:flagellar protein FlaG [Bacillaceae bacterium Marseille-Q3522]